MDWQDISTAPKDGTEILTYRRARLQAVAVWCGDGWYVSDGAKIKDPTHWMPLPSPPVEKE